MDVRTIHYCVDEVSQEFISMQVVLGHTEIEGDEAIPLLSHGGPGGECKKWVLPDHDFITEVRYTFNVATGYVIKVHFETWMEESRSFGRGSGPAVSYFFNRENQFLGFHSYEIEEETYAFGAFQSVCNHLDESDLMVLEDEVAEESYP